LMQAKDVTRNSLIVFRCVDIFHDEDAIKARQNSCLELDLLSNLFELIIASVNGIGSCKDGSS
jgi:hypothetical protein